MKTRTHLPVIGAVLAAMLIGSAVALSPRLRSPYTLSSPLQSPLALSDAEAQDIAQRHLIPVDAVQAKQAADSAIGLLNQTLGANALHFGGLWLANAQINIAVVKSADAVSFDARVQALREIVLAHGPLPYQVNFVPADFSEQQLISVQAQLTTLIFANSASGSISIDIIRNRVRLQSTEPLDAQVLAAQISMTNANLLPFVIERNTPVTPMWSSEPDVSGLITRIERVGNFDVLTLNYHGTTILFPRVAQPKTDADGFYPMAAFSAKQLTITDGCLAAGSNGHILWPNNVQPIIETSSGKLALINEKGAIVARLGEPFGGGGGELPKDRSLLAGLPPCLTNGDSVFSMNPMR